LGLTSVVELSGLSALRRGNKAQIAEFFDVSIKAVDGWIRRGCPVLKRGSRKEPWVMDALAVAEWRFTGQSQGDVVDPDDMAPQDRKAWYESETKRRALQVQDRELVEIGEVEKAVATAFSAIAQGLRSLPDNVERRTGCDPVIVIAMETAIDAEMDALADKLSMLAPIEDE
jgi:phage terminase Nu1 subunit (DNA packaging protein)